MLIKTGLLCIPKFDADACTVVRRAVLQGVPGSAVMLESSVGWQRNWIGETLRRWCDEEELDLILTIGGTLPAPGPSTRETMPEATLAVLERQMPSLSETMRSHAQKVTQLALLDRGVAGIRSRTLIINLPAGGAPALLFLQAIIEILPAVIAYLQDSPSAPHMADELEITDTSIDQEPGNTTARATAPRPEGLKVEEFAAFLQRRAGASKP